MSVLKILNIGTFGFCGSNTQAVFAEINKHGE